MACDREEDSKTQIIMNDESLEDVREFNYVGSESQKMGETRRK